MSQKERVQIILAVCVGQTCGHTFAALPAERHVNDGVMMLLEALHSFATWL